MKIELKNIGMISKASIEIRGISLIAGPNDSGKSTIGKVLYSIFRATNISESDFVSMKDKSSQDELFSIFQQIARYSREKLSYNDRRLVSFVSDSKERISENISLLFNLADNIEDIEAQDAVKKRISKLQASHELNFDDQKVITNELEIYLNDSFSGGVRNKYSDTNKSSILIQEFSDLEISIDDNFFVSGKPQFFFNDVIFIESPLIIKSDLRRNSTYTRDYETYLLKKINSSLAEESLFNNDKDLNVVFNKIQEVISGKISKSKGLRNQLLYSKSGVDFSMNNTATGIKTFGIIQLLLENGSLNEKTLLVIDEPEVHLHPNWQIKFAEILILLSKELNIQMLLTSHSPYFIEAIEEYSRKYNYNKQTNFYLTQKAKDGLTSQIIDVTKDMSPLLQSLTDAFYQIQDINDED